MKILHVSPAFYPAVWWGGPIQSVYDLCNKLASLPDTTLRVLTTDSAGPKRNQSIGVSKFPEIYPAGYEVYFFRRRWGASFAPGMFGELPKMIGWADVVHLTGTYSPPTLPTLMICRLLQKPVVWSPRGALQRWNRTSRPALKDVWDRICNVIASSTRCVVHVTSEQELRTSKTRVSRCRYELIPNGVNLPDLDDNGGRIPDGQLRLLFLGRLHPIKGIENLLRALRLLDDPTITLQIVGDGEERYKEQLRALVDQLGLSRSVTFGGSVEGLAKSAAFLSADVCVVPSYSENFGMVVAESLAHGVPVVAGRGTPWSGLEKNHCGLWVHNTPGDLANAIRQIRLEDLPGFGRRGREWMAKEFDLNDRALKMSALYRSMLE